MKFLFTCLIFSISLLSLAKDKVNTTEEIMNQFKTDYKVLISDLETLKALSEKEEIDIDNLKKQFFLARISYKKVEMLIEYFDRQFVKDHINGAPLPSLERKATNLDAIIEPSGFQIIEEELFAENKEALQELIPALYEKTKSYEWYFGMITLSDRMVFEAMREELIRIAALGITGFDTPSGENTLNESLTALKSIEKVAHIYDSYLKDEQISRINEIFLAGAKHFENTNFNDFDRFGFITEFVNPAYKDLLEIQQSLYIETRELVFNHEFSVNYKETNIFSENFLNHKYYSAYSNSGDMEKKEELGKILFFDPILSANNKRSCASCHDPKLAFTDGAKTSLAFDGESKLERNSPTIINSVFNTRLFWDARASGPEDQAEHVILNPDEFNTSYQEIMEKLNTCEEYIQKFNAAYPKIKKINKYTIVASLAAYVQSLRSFNSDFDKMVKGETVVNHEEIKHGFNVFAGKGACATCHFIPTFAGNVPPLYQDTESEVLAVPNVNDEATAVIDPDLGRFSNKRPNERIYFNRFAFKTPTIRNSELTAPYMHNGVFNTLEEVVEFYDRGGGWAWGIAPEHTTLPSDSLHLTDEEKSSLVTFMKSLTDLSDFTEVPEKLPTSSRPDLNKRIVGGEY
jgi:cytochrome c peroxidase